MARLQSTNVEECSICYTTRMAILHSRNEKMLKRCKHVFVLLRIITLQAIYNRVHEMRTLFMVEVSVLGIAFYPTADSIAQRHTLHPRKKKAAALEVNQGDFSVFCIFLLVMDRPDDHVFHVGIDMSVYRLCACACS